MDRTNNNATNELLLTQNEDISELIGTIDTFLDDLNFAIDTVVRKGAPQAQMPHEAVTSADVIGCNKRKIDLAFHYDHASNMSQNTNVKCSNQGSSEGDVNTVSPSLRCQRRRISGTAKGDHPSTSSTKSSQERLVVNHDYCDYTALNAVSPIAGFQQMLQHRTTSCISFPQTLHIILENANDGGYDDIISWQSHGRAFRVHNQSKFITQIMPNFFQQTRFASFQRQLALYGFIRLTRKGKDFGAYYHAKFLRGYPHLTYTIQRTPVKGTFVQKIPSPETEPDFYSMKPAGLNIFASRSKQQQQQSATSLFGPESKFPLPGSVSSSNALLPPTCAAMPSLSVTAAMYMSTQQMALKDYFSSILSSIVDKGTIFNSSNSKTPINDPKTPSAHKTVTCKNVPTGIFHSSPLISLSTISCIDKSTEIPFNNSSNVIELMTARNPLNVTDPTVSKCDAVASTVVPANRIISSSVLDSDLFNFNDDELLLPAVATDAIMDIPPMKNEDDTMSLSDYLTDADWDDGFSNLMMEDL